MFILLFPLSLLSLFSAPFTLSLNQDGLYLQRVKLGLFDPTQSLSSWNPRDDTPCNWYGITCHSSTHRVTRVDLPSLQLAGPLPSFFCRLPSLSSLSLPNNSLNSSLTVDFSMCQNLTYLDLAENYLSGPLPESLSKMPNLQHLDLTANSFIGELPLSFGEFSQLESLLLAGNLLNGTLPSFLGNITSLKNLLLAYNSFSPARIPAEIGNLTNLEVLWLSGCNLVGPIPASLGRLTQLSNLDLSINGLIGSIPSSFTGLTSIVQMELYNNSLSGEFPIGLSNLTKLRRLDASMNEFVGTIPADLCGLELGSLVLYENRFDGHLPENITRSPNLYELKLFNNKLSGQLPDRLGNNSPIESLDVSYNQFSGKIPENLCAKGALEELILIYNEFTGVIPPSLGKCKSLLRVRLRNNKLSGAVPDQFWGLPHVYLVELVGNSLSGNVSELVGNAYNLSILLISKNSFSGSIPDRIGSLGNLVEFSGSDNNFMGPIPESMVNLTQLSRLDLSGNRLSGEIPGGIRAWTKLNELNLANNELSGKIPYQIGSLPVLNYLDLSSNHFTGKIPTELQNLKLNMLNLSNNMLSGDLPPFYSKEYYKNSFLGNPELCGNLEGLCSNSGKHKNQLFLWILRSIYIMAGIVFVAGVVWFYLKYQSLKNTKKVPTISKWRSFHKLSFSEFEILDCLNEDNVIGNGASGKVYKVVLSNGEVVAVKKLLGGLKKEGGNVNSEKDGFEVEVETVGRIRHNNIVRLWCCCNTPDSKLLVYEFMPNGSLGDLLHTSKGRLLDWRTRYKIALDAAEGLSYLHHDCVPPIIHRDIKSNNILLDGEFGAKVADFGVAKVVGANKAAEPMSVITGSCGYIAPEYAYTLRVNEKSDIYSFGVVMLELVTGKPPNASEFGEKDLVKWVCANLDHKGVNEILDSRLESKYHDEIRKVLDIALLCTCSLPINRPSMRRVVKMLLETGADNQSKTIKKDGKLSPYYYE